MQTNRKGFLELLQRYVDGSCSPEEKQMMDYWYDLLDQEQDERTDTLTRNQLEELLWAKIQQRTQSEKETDNQTITLKWWQQDD
jgi:transmembrane sensor